MKGNIDFNNPKINLLDLCSSESDFLKLQQKLLFEMLFYQNFEGEMEFFAYHLAIKFHAIHFAITIYSNTIVF